MATTVTKTIKSSGGDYSSLSAFEAALPASLVTADQIWQAECYNFDDTTSVTFSGFTTDATRYVRVYGVSPLTGGAYSTSLYRKTGTSGVSVTSAVDIYFENIQFKMTNGSAGGNACLYTSAVAAKVRVGQCLFNVSSNGSSDTWGMYSESTSAGYYNNLIMYVDPAETGSGSFTGIYGQSSNIVLRNSTLYGFNTGCTSGGGTHIAKNVGLAACTTNFSGTWTQTTCSTTTPTFVDAANRDLRLQSGDTTWKDTGTNISADTPYSITTDIAGTTRSGSWDIGAYEYVAAGGGGTVTHLVGSSLLNSRLTRSILN